MRVSVWWVEAIYDKLCRWVGVGFWVLRTDTSQYWTHRIPVSGDSYNFVVVPICGFSKIRVHVIIITRTNIPKELYVYPTPKNNEILPHTSLVPYEL